MPELPEVETVVRDLNKKVKGRTITGVWFDWPKLIKHPSDPASRSVHKTAPWDFEKFIKGEKILSAKRIAKNILISLSGGKMLLIHQKMTGHLLVGKWRVSGEQVVPLEPKEMIDDSYNGFIHLILYLDNGQMLALSDVRKFAKVIAGTREEIESLPELVRLGPDALDPELFLPIFAGIIGNERRPIKQVLLDPEVIAGIGNIYSDDILYQAKVHPLSKANQLPPKKLQAVYRAMRDILAKAVKLRGTSTSDFRDTAGKEGGYTGHRLVYQREGEPCGRCKTPIAREKVGGRSAHYCPKCQVR
jgi:formamidopyrimidine-DNA glycosylase